MTPIATPVAEQLAPPGSQGLVRAPALLSLNVGADEDVEWIWTHTADGRSVVTGYRIASQLPVLAAAKHAS